MHDDNHSREQGSPSGEHDHLHHHNPSPHDNAEHVMMQAHEHGVSHGGMLESLEGDDLNDMPFYQ